VLGVFGGWWVSRGILRVVRLKRIPLKVPALE